MTKKNSKEEDHVVSDEMSQLQHELEMLKTSNTALTAENERLMKEAEQFAESLAPQPYLVVFPFKKSEAQGKELMLAIKGWMKHFQERFKIAIVGNVEGFEITPSGRCEDIILIPHECRSDNPPLDIVSKLLLVINTFPEYSGFCWTNDDIYPVNDFDITEVKLLKSDGKLTDPKSRYGLYATNREKTLNILKEHKLSIYDYGCHLPVYYESENVLKVIEMYGLDKTAMLFSSLYFNTIFPQRIPVRLELDHDNLKAGVYRPNANLGRLKDLIPGKIWVNNSVKGWSPELEKIIEQYV